MWTGFIQSIHYGCDITWCRPILSPLSALCEPQKLYQTLALELILLIVQRCTWVGRVICVQATKSLRWETPTAIFYRFRLPQFYTHNLVCCL